MNEFEKLEQRRDGTRKWLEDNHPSCFSEQLHLNDGSTERAYWHYGYMVALTDALRLLSSPAEVKQ